MGKTYYKYPAFKDYSRSYTRWAKRQASKAVRRNWDIDDGGEYKKCYCRYNIYDFKFVYYYESSADDSWYARSGQRHKVSNKNFIKDFGRESIRYNIDSLFIDIHAPFEWKSED